MDDSGATVEDLGSKNGTFVRGRRIEKPARLADKDAIKIGPARIEKPARLADKDAIKIGPASMIFRLFKRTGSTASTVEKRGRA